MRLLLQQKEFMGSFFRKMRGRRRLGFLEVGCDSLRGLGNALARSRDGKNQMTITL